MNSPSTFEHKTTAMKTLHHTFSILRRFALALTLSLPLVATAAQLDFDTPEAAIDALMAALKADSDTALVAIFGDAHRTLVIPSDPAEATATRARIHAAMRAFLVLREPTPDRRVLVIGDEAWPAPIPIVRAGNRWHFATEEGAEELINRRIGGNERNAIAVLRAYIDAQRAYASRDRDGDGVLQYAGKLASAPSRQDGLYWPADPDKGEAPSPLELLVAENAAYLKGHSASDPFRGYHFRILARQGKNAPGGAYNYVINGRMLAGFAMVAYPADHGRSGVMTFLVNHNGEIYEKNLGQASASLGTKMMSFDPGPGWRPVVP
jgi:hypothetical protein